MDIPSPCVPFRRRLTSLALQVGAVTQVVVLAWFVYHGGHLPTFDDLALAAMRASLAA